LLERALQIKEKYFDAGHIETATTLSRTGRVYLELGDSKIAKELLERALQIKEKYFDAEHVELSYTLENLSKVYLKMGNYQRSKELYNGTQKLDY